VRKRGALIRGWKTHVRQHTAARVAHWSALIRAGKDHSLETSGRSPEQALADLDKLSTRISTRNPDDRQALEQMSLRAAKARKPANGQAFSGCVSDAQSLPRPMDRMAASSLVPSLER
jgi:hypothetical protein